MTRGDGYLESEEAVVTWCVGHLVTMSYPEAYDPALKRWSLETLPFLPAEFKYEIIPSVAKQFKIVKSLLTRKDVERIYAVSYTHLDVYKRQDALCCNRRREYSLHDPHGQSFHRQEHGRPL